MSLPSQFVPFPVRAEPLTSEGRNGLSITKGLLLKDYSDLGMGVQFRAVGSRDVETKGHVTVDPDALAETIGALARIALAYDPSVLGRLRDALDRATEEFAPAIPDEDEDALEASSSRP